MALTATIYRLKLDLSDIDRNVYEQLDFRVAQHPSESPERLMARIIAYGLFYKEALEFGRGISNADEPALWQRALTGEILHWIDLGTPSPERIHMASKKSQKVTIVTYKGMDAYNRGMEKRKIHRGSEIQVIELEPKAMSQLGEALTRTSQVSMLHADDELNLSVNDLNLSTTLRRLPLPGQGT